MKEIVEFACHYRLLRVYMMLVTAFAQKGGRLVPRLPQRYIQQQLSVFL